MLLKIVEDGKFKDIKIEEGEMFMLPRELLLIAPHRAARSRLDCALTCASLFCLATSAYTPHSPVRFENTVGLVVERTRPKDKDGELHLRVSMSLPGDKPHSALTASYSLSNDPAPTDEMRWYCPAHTEPTIIKQSRFHCTDLGTQLKPVIQDWIADVAGRKCAACGRTAQERELIEATG